MMNWHQFANFLEEILEMGPEIEEAGQAKPVLLFGNVKVDLALVVHPPPETIPSDHGP
jgi:hypothetical protein